MGYCGYKPQKGEKVITITDNHGDVLALVLVAPVNETDIVLLPEGLKALKRVSEETKKLLECLHERLRELYIQPGMQVLDGISTRHPQYGQDVSHETEHDLEDGIGHHLVFCACVSQMLLKSA